MSLTRRVARPMMAAMFVVGGWDSFRNPDPKAPTAEPVTTKLAGPLNLPDDPATLVKVNGGVQVGAGVLLAIGKLPRLSALALAGTLVPTTLAGHRFWEVEDAQARRGQRIHFLKNLSMLGGLILAATDTEGRPSLRWRARQAAKRSRVLPG
ncbi:MAG TPA: DoxX family protein [Acidimicrobiales bacterium]|jgi:uncharacterized membrane protein YphA (DoxX/SURF4 family)